MKLTLLLIASLISFTSMAQTGVQFDKLNYNYGKLKLGVHKSVIFSYTNNDAKPAVIEFANSECGCTQPEYNQKPILKGQKGTINIIRPDGWEVEGPKEYKLPKKDQQIILKYKISPLKEAKNGSLEIKLNNEDKTI
mgnify:CR=1 FL=1